MGRRIYEKLGPVRTRQLLLGLLKSAAWGLLVGSIAGMILGGYRFWAGSDVSAAAWITLLAGGPVVGLLCGLIRHRTWERAAEAVDSHYDLKDRAVTALSFLSVEKPTPWHELAVADAEAHLAGVQSREVVPFRSPRTLFLGFGSLAAALLLLIYPLPMKKAKASLAPPRPETVAMAKTIEERLKALDELSKEEKDEKLDATIKELKQKIAELQKAGVDEKEELAKLSEMQTALASQQAEMNIGLVDGQLASLGEALTSAAATEGAGKALQDAKFDQAAKELEKLEAPDIDKKEARALEEKLKQVAKQMGEAGLGQIGEAANELADGVKGGNSAKISKAGKGLAGIAKKHARRRRINQLLTAEIENLSECKNGQNGGSKSMAKAKSKSPSNNWGRSVAGNIEGEKTNLLAKRDVKEITGTPDEDGPSEMETTHSPEGREQASRAYKKAYDKAKKQSEAVLDNEPIPLGHRQTIRKYFELIRPQNDAPATDKTPQKPATNPGDGVK